MQKYVTPHPGRTPGLTKKEKQLESFLDEHATEQELDLILQHVKDQNFDQADLIIEQILTRIA